jgi:hypothetical protein
MKIENRFPFVSRHLSAKIQSFFTPIGKFIGSFVEKMDNDAKWFDENGQPIDKPSWYAPFFLLEQPTSVLVTKNDIQYGTSSGKVFTIPKGTDVMPSHNLPEDGYWACFPEEYLEKQGDEFNSWHRNYGFFIHSNEVENVAFGAKKVIYSFQDGEKVYWSNMDGWVDRSSATIFLRYEIVFFSNFPIGSEGVEDA